MKVDYKIFDSNIVSKNIAIRKSKYTTKLQWDIRKESAIKSGTFDISRLEVALYTALALISNVDYYSFEVAEFALSYFIQMFSLLEADSNNYLSFKYDNVDMLRDFSKSTRVGEIAQGINYFYALNYLGAKVIYDYGQFCALHGLPKKNVGRKPDYVLDYLDGTYGIIESKGSLEPNITGMIESAHEQCNDGKANLSPKVSIKDSYAMGVSFATSSPRMRRNTILYISDPQEQHKQNNYDPIKSLFFEYSKFFFLVEDEKTYSVLRFLNSDYLRLDDFERSNIGYSIKKIYGFDNNAIVELGITSGLKEFIEDKYFKYNEMDDFERIHYANSKNMNEFVYHEDIADRKDNIIVLKNGIYIKSFR